MKNITYYIMFIFCLFAVSSCSDEQNLPNGYIAQTEAGSLTGIIKGYNSTSEGFSILQPEGFRNAMYITNQQWTGSAYSFIATDASQLSHLNTAPSASDEAWVASAPIIAGKVYWIMCDNDNEYRFMKLRVAYINGNNVGVEYVVTDQTEQKELSNANANYDIDSRAAIELEMPRINTNNFFAPHYVSYNGRDIMNLAVEWNKETRHANWVAYYWDSTTSQDNVSRGKDWTWDPLIPTKEWNGVVENDHKSDGYDKGHLCASEDRVYCKDANDQTFYYSNISCQIGNFNQQYWAKLENLVQRWGRSTTEGTYDAVYVTKGGTINDLKKNFTGVKKANDGLVPTTDANGFSKGGLAVPSYYFMALLAVKGNDYQAIAFFVPHTEDQPTSPTTAEIQKYAISIKDLEAKTGIDFFCNLPDRTEREVESTLDLNVWAW